MAAKSLLMSPQGLRPEARAPLTPLLRHCPYFRKRSHIWAVRGTFTSLLL